MYGTCSDFEHFGIAFSIDFISLQNPILGILRLATISIIAAITINVEIAISDDYCAETYYIGPFGICIVVICVV